MRCLLGCFLSLCLLGPTFGQERSTAEPPGASIGVPAAKFANLGSTKASAAKLSKGQKYIIEWSRPAESLFGYTTFNELKGMAIDELVPKAKRPKHGADRQTYYANRQVRVMGDRFQLEGSRKDGSQFPCEVLLIPGFINRRPVTSAIVLDMTKRVEAAKQGATGL
jgi:PAS domain S-box-containing protein